MDQDEQEIELKRCGRCRWYEQRDGWCDLWWDHTGAHDTCVRWERSQWDIYETHVT